MTRFKDVFRIWRVTTMVVAGLVVLALMVLVVAAPWATDDEVERLIGLLQLRDGTRVAEIGAGTGWLTVEVAREVGFSGHVYSTEISLRRLDDIREVVSEADLGNVTVVEGGDRITNLPAECCDAVFMRRVYHHFTSPSTITRDLHDALVDGGRLVIIEFEAGGLFGMVTRMGTDQERLISEVTASGFELESIDSWPGVGHYVAVFRKSTQ